MFITSKLAWEHKKTGNREKVLLSPGSLVTSNTVIFFRRWSKACMLLTCILGLTWLFGVFYINQESLFMAYCFTIFNTLQVNHETFHTRYRRPVAKLLLQVKTCTIKWNAKSDFKTVHQKLNIPHWKDYFFLSGFIYIFIPLHWRRKSEYPVGFRLFLTSLSILLLILRIVSRSVGQIVWVSLSYSVNHLVGWSVGRSVSQLVWVNLR